MYHMHIYACEEEEPVKIDICDWLRDRLKSGPVDVTDIRADAKVAGYARGELREAKCLCGVRVENNWSHDNPVADRWFWSLPEEQA